MKYLFTITICLASLMSFAQQKTSRYILIVRSKAITKESPEKIKSNIQHWTDWMSALGKDGKIEAGYRATTDGITLTAGGETEKASPYTANGEIVSSFLIIRTSGLKEAKQIAAKCPVFELGGSVEIRPLQNTAN